MKKLLGLVLTLFSIGVTFATVGGPTVIGDLYYDEGNQSIRYSKTFYDGLGGSEIHKYSITTQKNEIVTELDTLQFEEGRLMSEISGLQQYFETKHFLPLKEFALNKLPVEIFLNLTYFNELINDETFEIAKVAPHPFIENPENYMMSGYIFNFGWTNRVYIANQIKSEITVSTCRLDPINYRGFAIENVDTIVIIATSEKKDCVEGGYLGEEVHILSGVLVSSDLFLAQNTVLFNPSVYQENWKFQASTGGLWIEPTMMGDNKVSGVIPTETQNPKSIRQILLEYMEKLLTYINL